MGTILLRIVPIHFLQPKSQSAPGYCYSGRLLFILSNYFLPITLRLSLLRQNFQAVHSTFRTSCWTKRLFSIFRVFLSESVSNNQLFLVLSIPSCAVWQLKSKFLLLLPDDSILKELLDFSSDD